MTSDFTIAESDQSGALADLHALCFDEAWSRAAVAGAFGDPGGRADRPGGGPAATALVLRFDLQARAGQALRRRRM